MKLTDIEISDASNKAYLETNSYELVGHYTTYESGFEAGVKFAIGNAVENEKALLDALALASTWGEQLTDHEKIGMPYYAARLSVIDRIFEQYKDKIVKC